MANTIVEMKGIEKSFNENRVLKQVDFRLKEGSIHALLGENGTGKTTLMNILGGVLPRDAGQVLIGGKPVEETSHGMIAFIHQELSLINDLNVCENMFLGREPKKGLLIDRALMEKRTADILSRMNVELSPNTMVGELNASYKQIVEIARALMQDARVIIMDEPTTALTDVEISHIFGLMRGLRDQGVSIVFISHKLNEVVEICDEYTVMRDGVVVATGQVTPELTENQLASYMVGKELRYDDLYQPRQIGDVLLELKGLSREREFHNVSMNVRASEIVGVTGLLGDGRSEVFATVYGCNRHYDGQILLEGREVQLTTTERAQKAGISYVPRNRKENGIIRDMSVADNMSISVLSMYHKGPLLDRKALQESNERYVKELNIKVSKLSNLITSLSGGNQQKAVLGKALGPKPRLVILDNPTQGVDVGAKLEIYNIIMQLAKTGVSFVILSSEAQEIMMLCDRSYVMFHGEIRAELKRSEFSEEHIMVAATGGQVAHDSGAAEHTCSEAEHNRSNAAEAIRSAQAADANKQTESMS